MEALVFILIGLSLRGVIARSGGVGDTLAALAPAVGAVLAAVILSRFVWVFATERLKVLICKLARREGGTPDWRSATVTGWAGMRGVVTLAIALSLPEAMPGRDLILVASFAVILVTVLGQGTTIGPLIRWINPDHAAERNARHLNEPQACTHLEAGPLATVRPLAHGPDGSVIHPRLLEQCTYCASLTEAHQSETAYPADVRAAHYDVVLAAVAAARVELLRLHRTGLIHDELLTVLEHDLDLQEIAATHGKG